MSESEGKMRTRSQTNSKKASRDSSREPSTSRAKVGAADKDKIKSILKAREHDKSLESGLTSAAESSAGESDLEYDTAYPDADDEGGILHTLKNLQYGTHVALKGKSKRSMVRADKLIKADSNQNLVNALKQERLKGAEIYAALMDGGSSTIDSDIPHFKPFNRRLPPCSSEEFEKQLRMLQRNYPRFEGRCAEFIYFLMDIEAIKNSFNITNEQLAHILQNRLGGRLQKYFMIQMKRSGDVVAVLNRLGKDYVETIDIAAEVEKCATFKFQFKNVADELIKLKEMIAMAYPNATDEELRQIYIQKVTDKVPPEVRHAITEEFQKQRHRVQLGMPALTDDEIDHRMIKHLRPLERRSVKPVYKVKACTLSGQYNDVVSEDSVSCVGKENNEKSLLEGFVRSVQQIASAAVQKGGEINEGSPARKERDGQGDRVNNRKPMWQKRGELFERPSNFNPRVPPPNRFGQRGADLNKPNMLLAKSSDTNYPQLVEEIKSNENVRFLGQKIRNDLQNIRSEKFKQDLQRLRPREVGSVPIYTMIDGRYKVDDCPMITGPIIKKVGNFSPQLTAEVLRRFAGRCHACGFANCPQKGNPNKTPYRCIYERKADSWWPCDKCMRGFHLAKDCLALVKN